MWPSELAHFAPAVWIGRLVNRGHACCPGLQRRGVNKSSFVNVHASSPAFDHGKCLLICPFFIVTFSRLYFSKPHFFFIKNINRPLKTKGALRPTGTITLQCSVALESLLLLEAVLTVDTGLEDPKLKYPDPSFCKEGGNRLWEATIQGTPFWGKREGPGLG